MPPTQAGLVLVGEVVGNALIVTIVVLVAEQPVLGALTVTVYVPDIPDVTVVKVGVAFVEVNPLGPLQK